MSRYRSILRRLNDDPGFSMTELMAVVAIMGFVIAGAYGLSFVAQKAANVAELQSVFSTEVGTPLQFAEIYLQQNSGLEEWEDYRVVCFTDRDLDGDLERVIIEAHDDGRLTLDVWTTDIAWNNVDQIIDFEMSTHNANVAEGIPLIQYLNEQSVELTQPVLGSRASDTRTVIVTVVVEHDDNILSDDRLIHFRNRL